MFYQKKRFIFFIILTGFLCFQSFVSVFADDKEVKPEYVEPFTGMEFVFVKGGCYQMGDVFGDGEVDELPVHEVCIDDLYFGKYEVTNAQFRNFIFETGFKTSAEQMGKGYAISNKYADDRGLKKDVSWKHPLWPSDRVINKMDHPVLQVSITDALQFIKWLNRKNGLHFRLPTEAEWEYAARSGGKKYKYSWGNGKPDDNIGDESVHKVKKYKIWQIWDGYKDDYVYTSPVGSFEPNELGIYDMSGNVSEWCHDAYDSYYYNKSAKDNPAGPETAIERVVRGGSWNYKPYYLRCANRMAIFPNNWCFYIGIRLVMIP